MQIENKADEAYHGLNINDNNNQNEKNIFFFGQKQKIIKHIAHK